MQIDHSNVGRNGKRKKRLQVAPGQDEESRAADQRTGPAEDQLTSGDAAEFKFIRFTNEIEDANQFERPLIYLTNYEGVLEGKIDTLLYSRGFSGPS